MGTSIAQVVLAVVAALAGHPAETSPEMGARAASPAPIVGINAMPSMRPWRYSGANPDGWWCRPGACRGARSGTVFASRELALAAELGVDFVRLEFPWPLIEPRRGRYDWSRADFIFSRAQRLGLEIQPVLVYTPSWLASRRSSPPAAAAFARFAGAFARRYRALVRYYELWNEPNAPRYWRGTQEDYVQRVLVPGSKAVKRADPGGRVIVGGASGADLGWLDGLWWHGAFDAFDVLAYHDYSGDPADLIDNAWSVRELLRRHGHASTPIWLGEFGIQQDASGRLQVPLIETALSGAGPWDGVAWYALRDDFPSTCCPARPIKLERYGLLDAAYRPKPGFEAMRRILDRRAERRVPGRRAARGTRARV